MILACTLAATHTQSEFFKATGPASKRISKRLPGSWEIPRKFAVTTICSGPRPTTSRFGSRRRHLFHRHHRIGGDKVIQPFWLESNRPLANLEVLYRRPPLPFARSSHDLAKTAR